MKVKVTMTFLRLISGYGRLCLHFGNSLPWKDFYSEGTYFETIFLKNTLHMSRLYIHTAVFVLFYLLCVVPDALT